MALEDETVASDLKPCDADTHTRSNAANVMLTNSRKSWIAAWQCGYPLRELAARDGGPHQQMHVTWLRRAYVAG